MYSSLTLYYLDKIGIRPWVKRINDISEEKTGVKLIIFISYSLSNQSEVLLKHMVRYLNLPPREYLIVNLEEGKLLNNYRSLVEQKKPSAVLLLGLENTLANLKDSVILSNHPDYLLKNPSEKRTTFQDLQRVSELLAVHE